MSVNKPDTLESLREIDHIVEDYEIVGGRIITLRLKILEGEPLLEARKKVSNHAHIEDREDATREELEEIVKLGFEMYVDLLLATLDFSGEKVKRADAAHIFTLCGGIRSKLAEDVMAVIGLPKKGEDDDGPPDQTDDIPD